MDRYFDSIQFHHEALCLYLSSSAFTNVPEKYLCCLQLLCIPDCKQLRYFSGTLVKAEEDKT